MGYQWSNNELVDGVIINAGGVHIEQAIRRDLTDKLRWVLFDPQYYLKGLDLELCRKTCERLSTYSWFGGSSIVYNSVELTQKAWFEEHKQNIVWDSGIPSEDEEIESCIKDCLDFQVSFGATFLIAPIPLVENPDDEFAIQLKWIDVVAKVKDRYDAPILITLAFLDNLFYYDNPLNNRLFQTIVDNICVRTEFEGVYIVPVQVDDSTLKLDNKNVVETLLNMCNIFSTNEKKVVLNYADSLGFACLGAGAIAFGSGYSNKEKRMCFSDFNDKSGGRPYPRFYSHSLILDLLTYRDLSKIKDTKLLRLIKDDIVSVSEDLFAELSNGGNANNLPSWRESMNNITTAKQHRILSLLKKSNDLSDIGNDEAKIEFVLTWLQDAEAYRMLLESRLKDNPISDDSRHISVWLSAFEEFVEGTL